MDLRLRDPAYWMSLAEWSSRYLGFTFSTFLMQSCHPATLVFDPAAGVCNWASAPGLRERCEAAEAAVSAADNEIPKLELGGTTSGSDNVSLWEEL